MAKFAAIDVTNEVTRVIVVADDFVSANGGDQSAQAEEALKKEQKLKNDETRWVQTSKSFRGILAGPGCTYDSVKDIFLPKKRYPSWVLNSDGTDWEAPVAYPSITEDTSTVLGQRDEASADENNPVGSDVYRPYVIRWSEENSRWEADAFSDNVVESFHWNPSDSTWNAI